MMFRKTSGNFFKDVYEVVALIPRGRVTTYGAIAQYLGSKQSARMVGWALHQEGCKAYYPAHRVVNKQGLLTGKHFFAETQSMESLLALEGVLVQNDQLQNFENLFWDPCQELNYWPLD